LVGPCAVATTTPPVVRHPYSVATGLQAATAIVPDRPCAMEKVNPTAPIPFLAALGIASPTRTPRVSALAGRCVAGTTTPPVARRPYSVATGFHSVMVIALDLPCALARASQTAPIPSSGALGHVTWSRAWQRATSAAALASRLRSAAVSRCASSSSAAAR